jgi:hypothetical protein
MSESESRLPGKPSLEQLRKQAKELAAALRGGSLERLAAWSDVSGEITLADAQYVIARENGFSTWAEMKHHIESLTPPDMSEYERLATDLAEAYSGDDPRAVREVNYNYGTSFVCDHHDVEQMHRRLKTWFESESKDSALALNDARQMVAQFYGVESWAKLVGSVNQKPRDPRSAPLYISNAPPFYQIDWKENRLSVRGPQSPSNWERIASVMAEYGITKLWAGGISDDGMERISKLGQVTELHISDSPVLTDDGARLVSRMPQLVNLELGGWKTSISDRGLEGLAALRSLRRFKTCWTQKISDAGVAFLKDCADVEEVNLMGTPTGDGAIRTMAGKARLRRFESGRGVTDLGLPALHEIPAFKQWMGGEIRMGLMGYRAEPNHLMLDGPFTDDGVKALVGLDGLFGLNFFWHCPALTPAGLVALRQLPRLGMLGCEGELCDDAAMATIGQLPNLQMLMGQGSVATDEGFELLSRSNSLEYIWGRECPNLRGSGFRALSSMPALRGLAVSCLHVDDDSLATLPAFPALRDLMPMDVSDQGFRHVGACRDLERLWCMYCRDTTDAATEHLKDLSALKTYYAGMTKITDRSLEILSGLTSLESLEFWACTGITDAGVALLAGLPRLQEVALDGLPGVTSKVLGLFPANVRTRYSG